MHSGRYLVAFGAAAAIALAASAGAEPGCASCEQGKQAIDDQVLHRHVHLTPSDDLNQYCQSLLRNVLKSGIVAKVDSASDFVAGCEEEGHALLASQ
ncbi:hypothetical protein KIH27_15655 [Mycobacterium sp. M1]|uniref:Haemophore haem-binding domain-containing protein n=1 Tax=Mycolicibacter acidiphilus TaxID=2835306 RepID=A0ABS5RL77_9MYCO|nr:hypothetical protein [Mycolicibacter acidiphilus]